MTAESRVLGMREETPYYLIDEARMRETLQKIRYVQENSGAKALLALKCFSSWCAFPFMSQYFAGTTSSSLYEARLGREKFGGETHAYCVAWAEDEAHEVVRYCDKLIFNSVTQLMRFHRLAAHLPLGLRLNPELGSSVYELSHPTGRFSRLGVRANQVPADVAQRIDGAMLHMNCDNEELQSFVEQLSRVEQAYSGLLRRLSWLSLGGGISFTNEGYPLDAFCMQLQKFSKRHGLVLYLEPGEAAVKDSTSLVVSVLDIVHNELPTLIVDAAVETHLLDVLVYGFTPELEGATTLDRRIALSQSREGFVYRVCGRSCLAGDLFGVYRFAEPVELGQKLCFPDVGGYSMVKKNFFNGLKMPAILHRSAGGELRLAHQASYETFRDALS